MKAGFAAMEAKFEGLSERVDAQSGRMDTLAGEAAARQLADGEKIGELEARVRDVAKKGEEIAARQLAAEAPLPGKSTYVSDAAGGGGGGCPNRANQYHQCTTYCLKAYG
jgi:hypothetical protein